MNKIRKKDIQKIKRMVEQKFPEDPALQQIHIVKKVIAKEAELKGLSFLEYVRSSGRQFRRSQRRPAR